VGSGDAPQRLKQFRLKAVRKTAVSSDFSTTVILFQSKATNYWEKASGMRCETAANIPLD
jgi:hypothetical protein